MDEARLSLTVINPTRELVRSLSEHGPYKVKLYKVGRAADSPCECEEEETSDHVMLECSIWEHLFRTSRGVGLQAALRDEERLVSLIKALEF